MFGYNNGVIAGVLVLPSFVTDFRLPPSGTTAYNNIIENVVSLLQLGGLVGSVATFPLMKYTGRKIGMTVSAAVYLLGAVLQVSIYSLVLYGVILLISVTDLLLWQPRNDVCWSLYHWHGSWFCYSSRPNGSLKHYTKAVTTAYSPILTNHLVHC